MLIWRTTLHLPWTRPDHINCTKSAKAGLSVEHAPITMPLRRMSNVQQRFINSLTSMNDSSSRICRHFLHRITLLHASDVFKTKFYRTVYYVSLSLRDMIAQNSKCTSCLRATLCDIRLKRLQFVARQHSWLTEQWGGVQLSLCRQESFVCVCVCVCVLACHQCTLTEFSISQRLAALSSRMV
jgi:hypothetical protein